MQVTKIHNDGSSAASKVAGIQCSPVYKLSVRKRMTVSEYSGICSPYAIAGPLAEASGVGKQILFT